MTPAQRFLLNAAKTMVDYLARKHRGELPLGMYEDLLVARSLNRAIKAVEDEAAKTEAA